MSLVLQYSLKIKIFQPKIVIVQLFLIVAGPRAPFPNLRNMTRKATEADFDFVYGLYMHPQVNPFLLYEPMDRERFRQVYRELLSAGVKYVFEPGGIAVGMFKLIPLTHRTSHVAYLGGLAIHPAMSGKGFGQQMLLQAISLARQEGFLRIELSTSTNNERAIRLYERCGFSQEGILRKYSYLKS